jgi:hypothetical protein
LIIKILIGKLKKSGGARHQWLMPVILAGGRDQEDRGSKPAWENSLCNPISKKPITKRRLVERLKV